MSRAHTDGGVTLKVALIGPTAYGQARYRVTVRDELEDRLVFRTDALELPWVDDWRALRDAAGFLAYYTDPLEEFEPDEGSGVTAAELEALRPYAGKLQQIDADLRVD